VAKRVLPADDHHRRGRGDTAPEETLGPLAPGDRFESEKEAIAMANASELSLADYFFHARDDRRIGHVMEGLEYGMVREGMKASSPPSWHPSVRPRSRGQDAMGRATAWTSKLN